MQGANNMRPLIQTQLTPFLQRFNNFRDAEFRSVEILSGLNILLTLAVQDSARAFDWITIKLEFNGLNDAKLLENNQLAYLDMDNGISLLFEENNFAFSTGECYNISCIKNSSLYLIAKSLKYEEGAF